MAIFDKPIPKDFDDPTALPQDEEQAKRWQEVNRSFWEDNPMRYDWKQAVGGEEFSREYFQEIDRRFFDDAGEYLPWKKIPFDQLIDFGGLKNKDVLEIGVGSGSHAQLLASHAKSFTGIDLTQHAVNSTGKRLERFGLPGKLIRMDAEKMEFPDQSFDFVWSWGVIHHSSNTRKILEEIRRVLRPGGTAVTMVYHRSLWHYYVFGVFFHGILLGNLFKTGSIHKVVQACTDGGIARYYGNSEWRKLTSDLFEVRKLRVVGSKAQLVPLPGGKLKSITMKLMPNPMCRFITNTLHQGSFLITELQRPVNS